MTPSPFGWLILPGILFAFILLLTWKAGQVRKERDQLRMSVKAYKEVLEEANRDISRESNQKAALQAKLWKCNRFNYDLKQAPSGTLQLLTSGGTRLVEPLGSVERAKSMGIIAWAPVAERYLHEEIRLGLVSPAKPD